MATLALKSVIGKPSRNIGEDSTEIIVEIPSYDDIFYNKPKAETDIRIFLEKLLQCDIYAIETLFSPEVICSNELIENLIRMRNDIVKLDLFMLYSVIIEEYDRRKGTLRSPQEVAEVYRLLDFIERSTSVSFQDFDYVFRYSGMQKETIDNILNGLISTSSAKIMLNAKYRNILQMRDKWASFKRNEKTETHLSELIYNVIKQYHKYELVTSTEFYKL